MSTEFDDRGKRFTEQVRTLPTKVVIQTVGARIEGMIHVHPERRLSDELNEPQPFILVTSARISDGEGNRFVPFLAVARSQVLWVMPAAESEEAHEHG